MQINSKKDKHSKNKKEISYESQLCLSSDTFLEVETEGNVTVHQLQNHPIQKFFRKLKFKIPETKTTTLDEFGTQIVLNIEKGMSIPKIGNDLKEQFGSQIEPLYPRLLQYLKQLQYLSIIEINHSEEG